MRGRLADQSDVMFDPDRPHGVLGQNLLEDLLGNQLVGKAGILQRLRPDVAPLKEMREAQRDVAYELATALQAHPADEPVLFVVDNSQCGHHRQ